METKQCKDCKLFKSIEDFPTYKTTKKSGEIVIHIEYRCKKCNNLKTYLQKTNTPEKLALYKFKCSIRRGKSSERNRDKEKERLKLYWQKIKQDGRFKEKWIMRKYKLKWEDYQNMLNNQNHSCAICGIKETELFKSLFIDHCHTTKKVRGLLCVNCNLALGNFKDNIGNLENAINYLKQYLVV